LRHDPDQETISSNWGLGFQTWQSALGSTTHVPACAGERAAAVLAATTIAPIVPRMIWRQFIVVETPIALFNVARAE
jgi:hypothetical protein